ncbi:MAG: HEAT repeat domain-containing protein [Thermoguttaceae bacterium]
MAPMEVSRFVEMAQSGSLSPSALPELIRIAREEGGKASSVAVHLIGTLAAEAAEAVPCLVELLRKHREDAFGRTVARTLGSIGLPAEQAAPELRLAMHSQNKRVRKAAREATRRIEAERGDPWE